MYLRCILAVAILGVLTGCGTVCEIKTNDGRTNMDGFCGRYLNALESLERQATEKRRERCQAFGYKEGTIEYAACNERLERRDKGYADESSNQSTERSAVDQRSRNLEESETQRRIQESINQVGRDPITGRPLGR
jgi:hypothetical protein